MLFLPISWLLCVLLETSSCANTNAVPLATVNDSASKSLSRVDILQDVPDGLFKVLTLEYLFFDIPKLMKLSKAIHQRIMLHYIFEK